MCLFATTKRPYTAKRNLTCYKAIRIDGSAYTPSRRFKYKKDVLNVTKMAAAEKEVFADGVSEKYGYRTAPAIGAGFHSAKRPQRFLHNLANYAGCDAIICRFIIPKGGKYYLDDTGLVVSSQIILKETIFDIEDMNDMDSLIMDGEAFSIKDRNGKLRYVDPTEDDMNKFKRWER